MTKIVTLRKIADMLHGMQHEDPAADVGFDMSCELLDSEFSKHPCGTACCIGGWVQHLNPHLRDVDMVKAVQDVSMLSRAAAYELCWGRTSRTITPQQGAHAIRNAITYGDPGWAEVLAS
jgi:hypothetical protein